MKNCYGYIRVSTVKQGERGVSLQEQRAAIERYALRSGVVIIEWFEETLTAAKQGRPLFTRMMKKLRNGEASGVVIHKIDRSTRNLRDWADLGDLIDAGVAVHFANESVDLQSRGGRLSADIQAVVAADFIRNLRDETRKGILGRLRQGLYPFSAPLGYLDAGSGRAKTVDPIRGPLIAEAFQLYATGRYTLETLGAVLESRGLRNKRGRPIPRTVLSRILNNPFYAGLIRIRSDAEMHQGQHTALIDIALFQQVRHRLAQRVRVTKWKHDLPLRGLFHCSLCGRNLIGEIRKGHTYYRCHTSTCPTRGFREEALESALLAAWPTIDFTDAEKAKLLVLLEKLSDPAHSEVDKKRHQEMQLGAVKDRLGRLIDAFVDGNLDKGTFDERKQQLLEEKQRLENEIGRPADELPERAMLLEALGLISAAQQSYELGNLAARRELAFRLTSDRSVAGKNVSVEPHPVLRMLANRRVVPGGDPYRNATRTLPRLAWKLWSWSKRWQRRQDGTKAS